MLYCLANTGIMGSSSSNIHSFLSKRRIFGYKCTYFLVNKHLKIKEKLLFRVRFFILFSKNRLKGFHKLQYRLIVCSSTSLGKRLRNLLNKFLFKTIPESSCLLYQQPTFPVKRGKSVWFPQNHDPFLRL